MSNVISIRSEIKKLRGNLISNGMSRLKLEMISYSDNDYDVTDCFVVFKIFGFVLYFYKVSLLSDAIWLS